MTAITAAMVKELRERSGGGMMDCKKALGETNGNVDEAIDWLRTKGLATASKKAGRTAAEGLVGVYTSDSAGAVVEVNTETDFVARNEEFQAYVRTAAELALQAKGDIDALKGFKCADTGRTAEEQLTHLIATIGENMVLRRSQAIAVSQGVVASYIHNAASPGLGRIGVLVALESSADTAKLTDLGKQIAMHIAATHPQATTIEELDPKMVENERSVLSEQAKESGKPDNVI